MQLPLESLCKTLIDIVKDTGTFIRSERIRFDENAIEYKRARDLVSYVDRQAEMMIVEKLKNLLPEAGFLTEEKTINREGAVKWIIDPLDGTTNYLTAYPVYATTVALATPNEVLIGVTYDIVEDKCYYAWKGGGAFCDNTPLKVKPNAVLANSTVIVGFPYDLGSRASSYFELIHFLYENTLGIRATGSAAIDLAWVAAGKIDSYVEFNIQPWDIAAGYLLVKEAGGFVSDFSGTENTYTPEIVACGNVYPEMFQVCSKYLRIP